MRPPGTKQDTTGAVPANPEAAGSLPPHQHQHQHHQQQSRRSSIPSYCDASGCTTGLDCVTISDEFAIVPAHRAPQYFADTWRGMSPGESIVASKGTNNSNQ